MTACRHLGLRLSSRSDGTEVYQCGCFGDSCVVRRTIRIPNGLMRRCDTCPEWSPSQVTRSAAPPAAPRVNPVSGAGRFCYWSCDTTPQGPDILATMVASARRVGVLEDFHVFARRNVPGATVHSPGPLDIKYHVFKWTLLRDRLAQLDYDYFVWLDSDNYFVRHPGNFDPLLRSNPIWCLMESEFTSPSAKYQDWWGVPLPTLATFFRDHGVYGAKKYNTNGGMFIVRKEAISEFVREALAFHRLCLSRGYWNTHDETPLAWIGQIWVDDPVLNTQDATANLWACDWQGHFSGRLPNGEPWTIEDWMTGVKRVANPAIVHAMRSKSAMAAAACEVSWQTPRQ
jgi:hypothetical protein